ncbi:MAG: 1-acyl-sn-glycerol-3-phosphate acyltransferase [Phyllobacteriaceae bacterium]|nr:1-acyl-sn-glycerol-3-phosphate acyltransferase [Phyllobacteriaceae bacterium]
MLHLRSALFTILFYLSNAAQMIFWSPVFFIMPRSDSWKVAKSWGYSHLWLQNRICGTRFDFRGLENIRPDANQLVASKHQSAWETYTMILFFKDSSYILKRSLIYIPVFGWYMAKMRVVPIDRSRGKEALKSITANARHHMAETERQVIIYPEGTRKRPGAEPAYKYGITHLYGDLGVPVQPVALNSGLYWGRRSLLVRPGTIIMEFLPVIEPGLDKEVFAARLEEVIERASNRLIAEAAASDEPPPLALELVRSGRMSATG